MPRPVAGGENLVGGLEPMQKALGDPQSESNIAAATARFDQAYKDLGTLFPG